MIIPVAVLRRGATVATVLAVSAGLTACSASENSVAPKTTASADTRPPACVSALDKLHADMTPAERASSTFSTTLADAATGPASGFGAVATSAHALSTSEAALVSDYTDLIPLAKADYAAALQDAATELQSASGLVNSFGDAAQAYADDESNATTDQLNATATAAVDAPKKAAAAISNVESVYRSAGGNVCS